MNKTGHLSKEQTLFSLHQGMVCHETYKDAKGNWLSPDEIEVSLYKSGEKIVKSLRTVQKLKLVSVKMSKSKKNVIDPIDIIDQFRADTAGGL